MENQKIKLTIKQALSEFYILMTRSRLRLGLLVIPVILGLLSSLFEGFTMALLYPTIEVLLYGNFDQLTSNYTLLNYLNLPLLEWSHNSIVLTLVFFILLTAFAKVIFNYWGNILVAKLSRNFELELRSDLFNTFLDHNKLFFDRNSLGYLHQLLMDAVRKVSDLFQVLYACLQAVLTLVTYFIIMSYISPKLTLYVMFVFPVLFISLKRIILITQSYSGKHYNKCMQIAKNIQNTLGNIPLIKAYNNENYELKRFHETAQNIARLQLRMDYANLLISPLQELILLIFLLALLLLIHFFYLDSNRAFIATAALFIILLRRSAAQVSALSNFWNILASIVGPLEQLKSVYNNRFKYILRNGTEVLDQFTSNISFQNVSFSYLENLPVLFDLNFTIEKGQTIALVGATGSGKSTCINLLMRFVDPTNGEIFIDQYNLKNIDIISWRRHLALVSQDIYLFNDTIRSNLVYGLNTEFEDRDLREALESACLYEFIERLPAGLETIIGDRGITLSGGEKQRLSIARAFLKKATIILLDEATSALDSKTEESIQEALNELTYKKTIIVVAHRLNTIKKADKIIVLDRGRIIETGNLETLLSNKGSFYDYWNRQSLFSE
jgi:subfamily B ATP-binding cassette protein MsbA